MPTAITTVTTGPIASGTGSPPTANASPPGWKRTSCRPGRRSLPSGYRDCGREFDAGRHPPPILPHKVGGAVQRLGLDRAASPIGHPPPCGEGWGGDSRHHGGEPCLTSPPTR